jgi:hypothetical protein
MLYVLPVVGDAVDPATITRVVYRPAVTVKGSPPTVTVTFDDDQFLTISCSSEDEALRIRGEIVREVNEALFYERIRKPKSGTRGPRRNWSAFSQSSKAQQDH